MTATAWPAGDVLDFAVPPGLDAGAPPEAEGRARDDVRLLVAEHGRVHHRRLRDLTWLLAPGDLLVVNTSATLPAALPATRADGAVLRLHLSGPLPGGGGSLVELRRPAGPGSEPFGGGHAGERLALPAGGRVDLRSPFRTAEGSRTRLWQASLDLPEPLGDYLARHGHPIRYRTHGPIWPLGAYQTVFAVTPGSAESPSAGRAFSTGLVTGLVAAGVGVAPVLLHTGVSSLEAGEPPYPERYAVPAATAERVTAARRANHRVVAVGTTAARALETVTGEDRVTVAGEGWTDVAITPERGIRGFDALLTGWHEPRSSHLRLLEAVAGRALLRASYAAALDAGYRWHEFGDLHLVLR
ncbi:MAG TPA: S-adenosylmethionine:tRNA ribosyltransferase-isomerase [Egibacteraceae bacterium]|nr:S-adenosylmethionine:tRNA ribosyltransferase-isomerase [Egibacteraceae bacterium]